MRCLEDRRFVGERCEDFVKLSRERRIVGLAMEAVIEKRPEQEVIGVGCNLIELIEVARSLDPSELRCGQLINTHILVCDASDQGSNHIDRLRGDGGEALTVIVVSAAVENVRRIRLRLLIEDRVAEREQPVETAHVVRVLLDELR